MSTTITVASASGRMLDWLVATCEGYQPVYTDGSLRPVFRKNAPVEADWPHYSTDWAFGGAVIEREKLDVRWLSKQQTWCVYSHQHRTDGFVDGAGFSNTSLLIAAMRCYVASKLGASVQVPEALVFVAQPEPNEGY